MEFLFTKWRRLLLFAVVFGLVVWGVHLAYRPQFDECGTTIVQYDEIIGKYFYETPTFRQTIEAYENTSAPGVEHLVPVDANGNPIHIGAPVSYMRCHDDVRYKLQIFTLEQWVEEKKREHRNGCIVVFCLVLFFGLVYYWFSLLFESAEETVPVVNDK